MHQAIITTSFQYPDGDFGITALAQWGTATHEPIAALSVEDQHREAATQFAIDRGWLHRDPAARTARLEGGAMPNSRPAFCWVLVEGL